VLRGQWFGLLAACPYRTSGGDGHRVDERGGPPSMRRSRALSMTCTSRSTDDPAGLASPRSCRRMFSYTGCTGEESTRGASKGTHSRVNDALTRKRRNGKRKTLLLPFAKPQQRGRGDDFRRVRGKAGEGKGGEGTRLKESTAPGRGHEALAHVHPLPGGPTHQAWTPEGPSGRQRGTKGASADAPRPRLSRISAWMCVSREGAPA